MELSPTLLDDTVKSLESLQHHIVSQLASQVLIHAQVKLCQPGSLPRSEGKAVRVIDKRKL